MTHTNKYDDIGREDRFELKYNLIGEKIDSSESLIDYSKSYLTFKALENGTFSFTNNIEYSIDNGKTWLILTSNTPSPTINKDKTILFRGNLTPALNTGIGKFSSTGLFNVMGNPLSLIYGDNYNNIVDLTGKNYALSGLFTSNTNLISVQLMVLPATTLSLACYAAMFSSCSNLIDAPVLPAVNLSEGCYSNMFLNCTSLTTAPELPTIDLGYGYGCYQAMFSGCTSLNYIKAMFTTTPDVSYTNNWVKDVAASGTFVKNTNASWNLTGNNGIPSGWTVETASE